MDWLVNSWDQVGSYNLGTGTTGVLMVAMAVAALFSTRAFVARVLAAVFLFVGLYFTYRGYYWFVAHALALPGEIYHSAFTASGPDDRDFRWTIWLIIIPMEAVLFLWYWVTFKAHRSYGVVAILVIVASYLIGGYIT